MMGILMLIGIVVTNAIVLISFVEQLRERGLSVYDALIQGGRVRLRPILMTAITTSIALLPLAAFVEDEGGILSAELATVVIGGLASSTVLTLVVVPVVYTLANESIPNLFRRVFRRVAAAPQPEAAARGLAECVGPSFRRRPESRGVWVVITSLESSPFHPHPNPLPEGEGAVELCLS